MLNLDDIERCFITNLPTKNISESSDEVHYSVMVQDREIDFWFSRSFDPTDNFFVKHQRVFHQLFLEGKFKTFPKEVLDNEYFENLLLERGIPTTPVERYNFILVNLFAAQNFEGDTIQIRQNTFAEYYLSKQQELNFYLDSFEYAGLIEQRKMAGGAVDLEFTFEGLNRVYGIQNEGIQSRRVFIAMAFSEKTKEIRSSIKKVCQELDYDPIIIDEIHPDAEVTVNDAIISEINKAKFLIADFTFQRMGVYFEAGYGLGQGKKVIFACSEKDFGNSHFDTNHFPHIVYEDVNDLSNKLKDKIEAWI